MESVNRLENLVSDIIDMGDSDDMMLAITEVLTDTEICLLYTSPSPRDPKTSRMPSSA